MDDKVFELMTKMYSDFTERFEGIENSIGGLKKDVGEIKTRVSKIESTLENETNKKIDLALEGQVQNAEKLDRIELEVAKHDEFIMKRIK